jgi:hypothetical protein
MASLNETGRWVSAGCLTILGVPQSETYVAESGNHFSALYNRRTTQATSYDDKGAVLYGRDDVSVVLRNDTTSVSPYF